MQCPNCKHWNEPGARFCEECGTELIEDQGAAPVVSVRPALATDSVPAMSVPAIVESTDVPPIPQQDLTPVDVQPVAPYTGPRLVLDNTGSIFKLGDATVIGREDPSIQIDLDGYPDAKYVSHRHAQIIKMNDKFYVEDLGSSNFTWVNDIKLIKGQSEPLESNDKLKLGKLILTFMEE